MSMLKIAILAAAVFSSGWLLHNATAQVRPAAVWQIAAGGQLGWKINVVTGETFVCSTNLTEPSCRPAP